MSNTTPAGSPPPVRPLPPAGALPPPPPKPKWQRLTQGVVGLAAIIIGITSIVKGYSQFFSLPACESTTASDTLKSIFKSKDVEVTSIGDFKSVTDTHSEKTCRANVETPQELADIGYRIYWEGWTTKVMVTDVQAKPKSG